MAGRELSLQRSFLAFALFTSLAVLGVFIIGLVHDRSIAAAAARRNAENLAQSLAQQASDTLESVDGVLLAVEEQIESSGTGPTARDRLRESFAALVTTMPRLHDLYVLDERGRIVVSNASALPQTDRRFDGRAYFLYHRSHSGTTVRITGPARSETENIWVMQVTRRINHPDGTFAGIAVAQIALDYFVRSYASVDVGRSGAIMLDADDATVIVRVPHVTFGRRVTRSWVFNDPYRYDESGSYIGPSAIDGVQRLIAFRRLDRYPLVVIVSLSEAEYLADWRSDAWVSAFALLFVVAMIAWLAHGVGAQIDRRKLAEDTLAELALMDGLTGLANRRNFDAALDREWHRAAREEVPLALLMIDVDHFKAYNDRYGHQHGDDVLISIARTIAANVGRPNDLAARYGGEEFAVILQGTDLFDAVGIAERIRAAVSALRVPHDGAGGGTVSVSIGAASADPASFGSPAGLLEAADAALYEAKGSGRNCTCTIGAGR